MLTRIRERASGWVAWVIVILITIPFALWGIQSYFEGVSETPIATVNGEEISLYAFQNQLSSERQRVLQQTEGNYDPALLNSDEFRNRVAESMVSTRLVTQYVRARNYRLSDAQLEQRIRTTPAFLRAEEFDPDLYRNILSANGFTPQAYEEAERQNAAIAQLANTVTESAFVTVPEINRLLSLQAQTRAVDYVLLPADRFAAEIKLEPDEVAQHYQDNLAAYQQPARLQVEYIELSVERLASRITPSAAELSDLYQQTLGRYTQAETRKASHILFSVGADADAATRAQMLDQAESVLAAARAGADFAELAKQHSADPGSKQQGGDLGVVAKGQMVAPFEEAVFAMREGEIRGPIETQFGFHLIKLTALSEAQQQPLAEVREQVAEQVRRARAESLFAEHREAFQNLVFENPHTLTVAAEDLELEIKQSDWFTAQRGEGIASEPPVRRAAFNEEVLNDDLNSAAIELGFDRLVALRKHVYEAAREKTLDEVRAQIEQRLKAQQAAQKLKQWGAQLVADLNAGKSRWRQLLKDEKLESKALPEARAQVPPELTELADSVFARLSPAPGTTAYNGVAMRNGDYALYALKKVTAGDVANLDEAQHATLRRQLLARDGSQLHQQLLQTILKNADFSIDREQIRNSATVF